MDDRLVYDGPERRTSPRVPLREERGYRWPDDLGDMSESEVEHARRWAGQEMDRRDAGDLMLMGEVKDE